MTLIIVESPTKARTFNRIFKMQAEQDKKANSDTTEKKPTKGKKVTAAAVPEYYVFATLGHIRDLPASAISIDYDHNYAPTYEIMKGKQKVVDKLHELAREHEEIIFATDSDREGESISYHAAYVLGLMKESWPDISYADRPVKRIVFHEITQRALEEALATPGEIRIDMVKAQQARRIVDRIVGYELSPLLWKKTGKNWLSAGRVQTVALRFVVEREKEIEAFAAIEYCTIHGVFEPELRAKLIAKDGVAYESTKKIELFAGTYEYTVGSITKDQKDELVADVKSDTYTIVDVEESSSKRYPPPPFTTSLLQQEAINRYGFTSKMIMRLAQDLYERGLITYHRTDSFNLSTHFVFRAKDYISATYGPEYALEKPRGYRTKHASAQEAHEAIRPTRVDRTVAQVADEGKLTKNHIMLYELIFNRAVATQMKEADIRLVKAHVKGKKGYELTAEHQQVLFDGFMKLMSPAFVQKHQDAATFTKGTELTLTSLEDEVKETKAPYRYSEATLIKILEERGIGRPSTYAAILTLIQDKGYVEKEGRYLKAVPLGIAICDYLSGAFPKLFDIDFTADMEAQLDKIADGDRALLDVLGDFYKPFATDLVQRKQDVSKIEIDEESGEVCPNCGKPMQIRASKFGRFLACSGYPECKTTKPILKKVAGKVCPKCAGEVVVRYSKAKKKFFGCSNYPKCDYIEFAWNKLVKAS